MAKEVHGNTYDYSKVNYKQMLDYVKIICKKHGDFLQYPSSHLRGRGCPVCANEKRFKGGPKRKTDRRKLTIEDFKRRGNEAHEYKYNYELVEFIDSKNKIKIICPEHGEFKQNRHDHMRGAGCPECSKKPRQTEDKLIKKFVEIHGDRYDYSQMNYEIAKKKINVICKKHGLFLTTTCNHLKGSGCPECSKDLLGYTKTNWLNLKNESKSFDSYKLYKIRCWNDDEDFYKIGITSRKINERFAGYDSMPYNYEVIEVISSFDGEYIWNLEKELNKIHKKENLTYLPKIGFCGSSTECFSRLIV